MVGRLSAGTTSASNMPAAHHAKHTDCSRTSTRRWEELAWMVKVWGAAVLLVLLLELAGIHPGGLLLRIWSQLPGLW